MRDKKKVVLGFFIALFLIVSFTFVSASLWDSITGKAVKPVQTRVNVVNPTVPPVILYVSDLNVKDLFSNSSRITNISFLVYSVGGLSVLPTDGGTSKGKLLEINIGTLRNNVSCNYMPNATPIYYNGLPVRNYSCDIPVWYFDEAGSALDPNWRINVSIYDRFNNFAFNQTRLTWLNALSDWEGGQATLNWSNVVLGSVNDLSDFNITVYNIGNQDIWNVSVNSTNLNGTGTKPTDQILASWFSSTNVTLNFNLCTIPPSYELTHNVFIPTPNYVNHRLSVITGPTTSIPASRFQGFCLRQITGIEPQVYRSAAGAPWVMDVQF